MASITDNFDIADTTLNSVGGWQTSTQDSGGVFVVDRYATATGNATGPTSAVRQQLAFQTTTEPEEPSQELTIHFTAATEGSSTDGVLLGAYGDYDAAHDSSSPGVWAAFRYMADGQRRLEVWSNFNGSGPDGGAASRLAYVDLVLPGSVVADGYEGQLINDGEVGIVQELHMRVDPEDAGLRVRAWVNNGDSDHPLISVVSKSDAHNVTGNGEWWFGINQASLADGSVAVTYFHAADISATQPKQKQPISLDSFPTLSDMRREVMQEYSGSQNVSVSAEALDVVIRYALRQILNRAGATAWWVRTNEAISLTFGSDNVATMPPYVERVIGMVRDSDRAEAIWGYYDHDASGNVRIASPHRDALRTEFIMRIEEPHEPEDKVPIPRQHTEALVLAAAARLAARDNNPDFAAQINARAEAAYQALIRDNNRFEDLRFTQMYAARRRRGIRGSIPFWSGYPLS